MNDPSEDRKLLRIETRNSNIPIEHKPPWIRTFANTGSKYTRLRNLVKNRNLHTVCEEAGCPKIFECWENKEATFLIGGDYCTRRCDFCQIKTGKPAKLDLNEPKRIAESIFLMKLHYSTITGVARDDLIDGGAWLYSETVRCIRRQNPQTKIELLVPDFSSNFKHILKVFDSCPDVLAHNVETVPRLFKQIRPAFKYENSLNIINTAHNFGLTTKSNLILGMGENLNEIYSAIKDLSKVGCNIITITQYLRPSLLHRPVKRWVHPNEFTDLANYAKSLGFSGVLSGPLVRSSYRAGELYQKTIKHNKHISVF